VATGRGGKRLTKTHVLLQPQAELFEELTRDLAAMADRLLRKHGKAIVDKQFALRRLADVMIDLFVLATVLSRVSAALESKGAEEAADELSIAQIFAGQARGRITRNFRKIDDNDDELIKELAVHTYERGGYPWDAV
jgi:acyl-CoA dehydrogenase family protein 9